MLELEMKMSKNEFDFGSNGDATQGIKFRFRDWDYTHEQTMMLKVNGETRDVHNDPLYALQGVPDGTRVKCFFEPFQRREQDAQEGNRRDRVRDTIGLRLVRVVAPEPGGKN